MVVPFSNSPSSLHYQHFYLFYIPIFKFTFKFLNFYYNFFYSFLLIY